MVKGDENLFPFMVIILLVSHLYVCAAPPLTFGLLCVHPAVVTVTFVPETAHAATVVCVVEPEPELFVVLELVDDSLLPPQPYNATVTTNAETIGTNFIF
jgi:hypothetical protein